MILFLKRRIVLIRTFCFDGSALDGFVSNEANEDTNISLAEKIESQLEILCTMVQKTIHAFRWQNHLDTIPEKIFFTGQGALYSETGNLLNQFLEIPTEQIDLRQESRILMDKNIAHVWNAALMDNALALALRDDKKTEGFNFRKNEFEVKKHYAGLKKEIRKVAVFLAIIFAFVAADLGVDYYLVKKRYTELDQNIREIYKKTFPEVTRITDPLQEMKVKINELNKSSTSAPGIRTDQRVLDLLKDISERVPETVDVRVSSMVVDPETVRISGETDTFNTVDNLKSGLEPSAYFSAVTIAAANLDRSGKRVQFELKLQRKNSELSGL
jgi:Tfp pilus assembly protein PilN